MNMTVQERNNDFEVVETQIAIIQRSIDSIYKKLDTGLYVEYPGDEDHLRERLEFEEKELQEYKNKYPEHFI